VVIPAPAQIDEADAHAVIAAEPADGEHAPAVVLGDIDALRPPGAVEGVAQAPAEAVPGCRSAGPRAPDAAASLRQEAVDPDPFGALRDQLIDEGVVARLELEPKGGAGHPIEPRRGTEHLDSQ
jgi:hypothetical protein